MIVSVGIVIFVFGCDSLQNTSIFHIKKADRTECIDNVEIAEQGASFEERLFRHDTAMQIQKILHDVPEPYKEVFMWRVYAELSFKQIGQIFGKSENWACVAYHRARNKIKEKLEVY